MRVLFATLAALGLATPLLTQAQTGLLNDTGITWSGDATNGNRSGTDCNTADPAGQDCHYGRDAQSGLIKVGGGEAGFDFTKVCNSGQLAGQGSCPAAPALGTGNDDWACTRDNVTGLIWEVKVNDSSHLRHMNHTYTWYNPSSPDGDSGTANGGTCKDTGRCDTEKFVQDMNTVGLCGATDWRMPTIKELEDVADLGRSAPAVDPTYFPNTPPSFAWSGSPHASPPSRAWGVNFYYGGAGYLGRSSGSRIRLVRVGQ